MLWLSSKEQEGIHQAGKGLQVTKDSVMGGGVEGQGAVPVPSKWNQRAYSAVCVETGEKFWDQNLVFTEGEAGGWQ